MRSPKGPHWPSVLQPAEEICNSTSEFWMMNFLVLTVGFVASKSKFLEFWIKFGVSLSGSMVFKSIHKLSWNSTPLIFFSLQPRGPVHLLRSAEASSSSLISSSSSSSSERLDSWALTCWTCLDLSWLGRSYPPARDGKFLKRYKWQCVKTLYPWWTSK